MPLKNVAAVAAVYFIIVSGVLLLRPGKVPSCIVCGNATLDLATKVIGLALAVGLLVLALRTPSIEGKTGAIR